MKFSLSLRELYEVLEQETDEKQINAFELEIDERWEEMHKLEMGR